MPFHDFVPGQPLGQVIYPDSADWDNVYFRDDEPLHFKILSLAEDWVLKWKIISGDIESAVGDLLTKASQKRYDYHGFAEGIFNQFRSNPQELRCFLRIFPSFLDHMMINREKYLKGNSDSQRRLIFYRLCELFFSLLEVFTVHYDLDWELKATKMLLTRQRFRLLAGFVTAGEQDEKMRMRIFDFNAKLKSAHRDYLDVLLNRTDDLQRVFSMIPNRKAIKHHLDHEADLLVINPMADHRKEKVWSFLLNDGEGQSWIDLILKKWYLAKNQIIKSNSIVSLMISALSSSFWGVVYSVLLYVFGFSSFGSLLFIAFDLQTPFLISILIGLVLPLFGLFIFSLSLKGILTTQVLYPFALRIPAMSMVGMLGVIGLVDPIVKFGYVAFTKENWRVSVGFVVIALLLSFAYIYFEVSVRTKHTGKSLMRSFVIFFYGLGSTFWVSIFAAWFTDAIGFTDGVLVSSASQAENMVEYLFHQHFLFWGYSISIDFVFFISALAFLIGVFTQIFWEDKSISEPL